MQKPLIDTPDGRFHDGDKTTGREGTIVTAAWLNQVQDAFDDAANEIADATDKATTARYRGYLGTQTIDDLSDQPSIGLWGQGSNSNALMSRGYPVALAGTLWVVPGPWEVMQYYYPYDKSYHFKRHQNTAGIWQPWIKCGEVVSVITGVVANGGTVPLPAGYTESQCRWFVAIREDNPTDVTWDINEDAWHVHYRYQCYTNGRNVVARTFHGGHYDSGGWIASQANYICIGVK